MLEWKMPVAAWGHDWRDRSGCAVKVVIDEQEVTGARVPTRHWSEVPRAAQAPRSSVQARSPTSCGFRTRSSFPDDEGYEHFTDRDR